MATALDDRTFESAVPLDKEQQDANVRHFQEKGYDVEVESDPGDEGHEQNPSAPAPESEAVAPAATGEPAAATPAAVAPEPVVHVDSDPVAEAEWAATKNDGEKLGWRAKKTKRIRELEAELATTTAKSTGQIEELQRQIERLSASPRSDAVTSQPGATEAPSSEAPKALDPIVAKPFDKAKPAKPKFEDFANEADPYAAFTAAVDQRNEDLIDWDNQRRSHEETERTRVASAQKERDDAVRTERQKIVDRNMAVAERLHPDFRQVTDQVRYGEVLNYLLHERFGEEGMELGYQLALPENREIREEIASKVKLPAGATPSQIEKLIETGLLELGTFRGLLKHRASANGNNPPQPAPAAAVPAPACRSSTRTDSVHTATPERRSSAHARAITSRVAVTS